MRDHRKTSRENEPAQQRLGWFESSTTFDDLVEEQGVGPFVWPDLPDEEDKLDVDHFLKAIFGDKMRR